MLHAKFQVKIIGLLVLEKKIFKGFYHIWAWRPSWSCDLDHLYKLSFPLPKEAPHTIWLWLAKRFQRRRCLNIVDNDNDDDGCQSKGISSPCEPDGSGELKIRHRSFSQCVVAQWLHHLPLVLEDQGSIPTRDEENLVSELSFLSAIRWDDISKCAIRQNYKFLDLHRGWTPFVMGA